MKTFEYQVICHLFYDDESIDLLERLACLDLKNGFFFFNISPSNPVKENLAKMINNTFVNSMTITAPPKGRDIGAKMQLLNLSLQSGIKSNYTLIVHDKRSPHLETAINWRSQLYKIFSPDGFKKVKKIFSANENVGVIGAASFIENEYVPETKKFICKSSRQIESILDNYSIRPTSFDFIAGNMFWIRTKLIEYFFATRSIMAIRSELEAGNALDFVSGTYIHSWERAMSWISTSQSKSVYGI